MARGMSRIFLDEAEGDLERSRATNFLIGYSRFFVWHSRCVRLPLENPGERTTKVNAERVVRDVLFYRQKLTIGCGSRP
jgi:hypothetical protein